MWFFSQSQADSHTCVLLSTPLDTQGNPLRISDFSFCAGLFSLVSCLGILAALDFLSCALFFPPCASAWKLSGGSPRTPLVYFPYLRDHCPLLPNAQCHKTIISCILFRFFFLCLTFCFFLFLFCFLALLGYRVNYYFILV